MTGRAKVTLSTEKADNTLGVIGFQGCMAAQRQPYEQNSNNRIVTLLHRHDQDDNSQDKEDGQQNEGKNQGGSGF